MIEVKQEAAFHFSLVEVLPVCLMMSSLVMSLIPALIGSDPMVQLHGGCVTRRSTRKGELLQRPLSTVPSVFVFSDVGVAARPLGVHPTSLNLPAPCAAPPVGAFWASL